MRMLGAALAVVMAAGGAAEAEVPTLRVAAQAAGTLNWELDTIRHYRLDAANGFALEVMAVAAGPAGQIAFQGGAVDAIVSDWIWVARQRAEGEDYVFLPFSTAVGGLMVPADSAARTLADLRGGVVGVAGGPLDKSWLILRAFAAQEYGFDLAAATEQAFGAPPLIHEAAIRGAFDGAVNFWSFQAKMEAAGMRELVGVAEAAAALGLDPGAPLLGYVLEGELMRERPALVAGLARASRAAKARLAADPAAWERLRPIMGATGEAEFEALRAGFLAGIPAPGPVDEAAAAAMLALMARLGGADLVGGAEVLPAGLFVAIDD